MELQWPLILFTSFVAASAGLFCAQGVYALAGKGQKAQMPATIVSIVLLAIGGIAVFFHLTHPDRIFNGFGHMTSGITQELIAIVVMAVLLVNSGGLTVAIFVAGAFTNAIPGIILQLVAIPVIVLALQKANLTSQAV